MFFAPSLFAVGLGVASAAAGPATLPGVQADPAPGEEASREAAAPAAGRLPSVVSLRWENDVVAGTDDNYTNGISLTYSRDGRGLLGGLWTRLGARGDGRYVSSYELGQLMMTPRDIRRPVPDPADRPYAGLLFVSVSTQYARGRDFDGFKFITGVVGPASLAEQLQRAFHRVTNNPMPQGWAYQLKNEPILNLVYERRRRIPLFEASSGWGAEAIPVVGGMLGNVLTQAEGGAQVRVGYNLPDDFGTTLMRGLGNLPYPRTRRQSAAARAFGFYVFAGGGGNLVARNLTLDGNTFRDGPRVAKNPAFAAGEMGAAFWCRRFEMVFSYVHWGREFKAQAQASRFGALTLAVHF